MKFEVFGEPMKHRVSRVFDISSQSKQKLRGKRRKSSKSTLIKTGYPNLFQGCDFLCFNLMNC